MEQTGESNVSRGEDGGEDSCNAGTSSEASKGKWRKGKKRGVQAICGANRGKQSELGSGGEDTCNALTRCEARKGKSRKGKLAGSAGNVWSKQGKAK